MLGLRRGSSICIFRRKKDANNKATPKTVVDSQCSTISNIYNSEIGKISLSSLRRPAGKFVPFNILFNIFVHLGHDSLLL